MICMMEVPSDPSGALPFKRVRKKVADRGAMATASSEPSGKGYGLCSTAPAEMIDLQVGMGQTVRPKFDG